ncbi:MAG: DUF4190 domain-containing protein [Clostridium sp.]|nr:DUF4190 domain-containing protein [Clostridium sp.]
MMNDTYKNQKPTAGNQPNNTSTSADRYATCALIAGITGLICSFFYLPASLISGASSPTGLICGVLGIILAVMSKKVDVRPGRPMTTRAIVGIVLSVLAIVLTFFFFQMLVGYYETLSDPVKGPQLNDLINRVQEQLNQQFHLSGNPS